MCWKPTWVCFRREIEIEAALGAERRGVELQPPGTAQRASPGRLILDLDPVPDCDHRSRIDAPT